MRKPLINVTEIRAASEREIDIGMTANRGGESEERYRLSEHAAAGLKSLFKHSRHRFLLEWSGCSVPHGAKLNGKEIATDGVRVLDEEGDQIGYCARIPGGGGNHAMLVFLT